MATAAAASSVASAVNSKARSLSEPKQILGIYQPKTYVEDVAILDLDHRSILARLAMETEDGMAEAQEIYASGRKDVLSYGDSDLTIKNLSAKAGVDLVDSSTYKMFVNYYGKSEYADMWVQAAFDGGATTLFSGGTVDFTSSSVGVEGRAGKRYAVFVSIRC